MNRLSLFIKPRKQRCGTDELRTGTSTLMIMPSLTISTVGQIGLPVVILKNVLPFGLVAVSVRLLRKF